MRRKIQPHAGDIGAETAAPGKAKLTLARSLADGSGILPDEDAEEMKRVFEERLPMLKSFVVTGTLTDGQTVKLDEAVPLSSGKVRLVMEPLTAKPRRPYLEVMEEIRQSQKARGHVPPSREEVDNYLKAERESWGD